jgi:hypothetical protein
MQDPRVQHAGGEPDPLYNACCNVGITMCADAKHRLAAHDICSRSRDWLLITEHSIDVREASPHPRLRQSRPSQPPLRILLAPHGPGMFRPAASAQNQGRTAKAACCRCSYRHECYGVHGRRQMHLWANATRHLICQIGGRCQDCGDALRNDRLDNSAAKPFLT